ncbi:hypothetical protein VOLCADRAFT_120607 [Volvox carteri f. nagariensis]|uniref:Patatin n=1 Tax=Volvox carteri f. nagariensis TaxID=3068 RepID=D8TPK3_VOLCA|nr:uncharacterized protein VOLCADRAFT_120607 [Volvox carteri f. nagariensis]EFJ50631.1 hypothetical protein VOLCADRAFT_120607 [Volvox carteri f. nagariensis]|eukprot:XP_002948224.1 hypothetical protein VOLCADRAFT_120607 [Volvox carteri f. nagariensis]
MVVQFSASPTSDACDLVLSSGFLAFAGHAGFLQAVEELGLPVGGVMGTSAGALAGSLYCAGYSPRQVAKHLSEHTPASLLRPSAAPWRGGALSLDGVISRLRDLLPPTFEELEREFAVGVVTADGRHLIIDSGSLPEAVAASAAIPFVFQPVDVPGHLSLYGPFKDGGVVDRVGLRAWRERRRSQLRATNGSTAPRPPPPCLVHVIDRSSPFSGLDDTTAMGESHIVVVKSPRSGANFFDLGSFEEHMEAARERARPHLAAVRRSINNGSSSSRRSSGPGGGGGGGGGGSPVNVGNSNGNGNGAVVEETAAATAAAAAAAAAVTVTAVSDPVVRATLI